MPKIVRTTGRSALLILSSPVFLKNSFASSIRSIRPILAPGFPGTRRGKQVRLRKLW